MLEGSPIGNAKVLGLLSRVSAQGRFSYIPLLLALAGAAVFLLAAGTNVAFADGGSGALQQQQHTPDAHAASQSGGGGGQTYARQVTDSVSVASNFDNPSSRFAARSFVRGMSDGVGVASEFGGPSGQTAAGTPARTQGPQQPASQRADAAGQRLLLGNNRFDGPLYGSGSTIAQSGTPMAAEVVAVEAADEMDFSELGTLGDGDDPDSNSHRLLQAMVGASQASSAMQGMVVYSNAVSGVYIFAIIAMVVNKSPMFARAKRKTVSPGAGRVIVISARDSTYGRLMVIVIAAIATVSIMSLAGSVIGEAFADTNRAAIAYRSTAGSVNDPKYREWDPVNLQWTSELVIDKTNNSAITHAWLEFSPISTKRVIITYSGLSGTGDGGLDSYVCYSACLDANSWTFTNNFATLPAYAAPADQRPFDMEYEQTSGDLLVVYDYTEGTSSATDDLFYRVMTDSQTSFGSESAINDTNNADAAAVYSFIRIASRKTSGSDQLALIAIDSTNSDVVAIIWNGSTWVTTAGQQTELTATVSITTEEAMDIAYETNSGDILIVAGEGASVRHNTYSALTGLWGLSSTLTGTWGVGTLNWLQLVPNPTSTSSEVFLIGSGDLGDLDSSYWSGSSWTDHTEHDASIDTHANRNFDFAWEIGTSAGLLVWGTAGGSISFKRFTASNTFASGTFTEDGTHLVMVLASNPTIADSVAALGLSVDSNNDIAGIWWNGASNNPAATGADDDISTVSSNARRPFSIDFQKVPDMRLSISDNATVSDSIFAVKIQVAAVSQNVTIADTIFAQVIGRGVAQTLGVSDSISVQQVLNRFPPDTVAFSDQITRVLVTARGIADGFSASDAIAWVPGKNLSDSAVINDQIATTYIGTRSSSETLSIPDSIERSIGRAIADTVTVAVSVMRSETNLAAIAYRSDDGSNTSMSPKYREWNVVNRIWGDQVELESSGSPIRNAWLEFSPVSSKRVMVVLSTDGTLDSYACDNGCTDPAQWTVTHDIVDLWVTELAATKRPFDIEYENTSGDLLLVYDKEIVGDGITTDLYYRIMPDSSHTFGSEASFDDSGLPLSDPEYSFVRMDARRTTGSDDIGIVALSTTNNRSVAWYWTGSTDTVGSENELTSSLMVHDYEAIGIGFETNTGHLIAVSGEGTNVIYSEFDGTSWTTETSVGSIDVGTVRWIRYVPNSNAGSSSGFLAVSGFTGTQHKLDTAHWGGTAWTVYHLAAEQDANIDDSATRAFDFAWDNSADATRGVLVYGTTNGSITSKRFAESMSWTGALTFSDDGTHPWVALNESSNPTAADVTSVLGAGIDSDGDIGGLKWEGAPPVVNPASTGNDGITTSGSTAYESFRIDYRHSTLIKKGLHVTLTITDQITIKIPSINAYDSITAADSVLVEKGTLGSSSAAAAVYKSETGAALLNSPKYREWDPATQTWSAEVELANIGSPMRDGKIRFSPDSALRAIVTHSNDGTLNLFTCDNMCTTAGSWTHAGNDFADTGTPAGYSTEPYRPYDTMFETTGERMMIVYDKELTEDADFYYRTYNGTHLSAESSFNLGGTSDNEVLRYFKLAAHPTTNEMVLTVMDATNNRSYALVWDGTTWTNQLTLSSSLSADNKDGESIGAAYEASGAAVVVSGNGASSLAYARWTGSWSPVSDVDPNPASGNEVKFVSVRGDPAGSSDRVMVCQSDDLADLLCSQFSAGTPGSWTVITSDVGTVEGRAFDYVYHPAGTTGMLLSATPSADSLEYRVFDGSGFGSTYPVSAAGTHRWIFASPANSSLDYVNALFLESDSNFDTGALKYKANAVTLIGDSSLTANSQNENHEGLHHEFQKSKRVKRAVADAVSLADTVSWLIGRNSPDTINILDLIARTVILARAQSESLPVAESVEANGAFFRLAEETLTVTDTLERIAVFVRATTEMLAVTDTTTRRYHASRSVTDTVIVTEVVGDIEHRPIPVGDALPVGDTITRTVHHSRSVNDLLVTNDGITRVYVAAGSASDTISAADSIARVLIASRSAADGIGLADAETRELVLLHTISDSVGTADAITSTVAFSRSVTDAVAAADSPAGIVRASKAIADSLAVTDTIARIFGPSRSISDSLSVADSAARSVSFAIAIADAVNVADAVAATENHAKATAESLAATDAIARLAGFARSVNDSVSVADSAARNNFAEKQASDTLTVTDAVAATASLNKSLSDALVVADTVMAAASALRSVADSVTMADAADRTTTFARAIADTATIADVVGSMYRPQRSVSDLVAIADAAAPTKAFARALSDAIVAVDAIARTAAYAQVLSDVLAVTDAITRTAIFARSASDTLAATDAAARTSSVLRLANDSLSLADTTARTFLASRQASDSLVVTDAVAAKVISRDVADNLAITDAITAQVIGRSAADALSVTDAITLSTTRTTTDALSVSDSVAAKAVTTRTISDALSLADNIVKSVAYRLADTVSLSDQVVVVLKPAIDVSESVGLADSIRTTVTRTLSDSVTVQDSARPTSTAVNIADSVNVTDVARITSKTVQIADSVGIADSARATSFAINIADSVAVADAVRPTSVAINIADALAIADHARPTSTAVNVADSLAVADQIKAVVPPRTADQVVITDSISLHVNRMVADAVSMSDLIITGSSTHYTRAASDSLTVADLIVVTLGKAVNIDDTLAVNASLTNISVHWNRNFGESLDLAAPVCLPNQCLHNVVLGESFQLGAAFSPPPQTADTLAVTDSITRGIKGSSVPHPSDAVTFSDSVTAQIIGILVVEKKEYAGPLPSTPVAGNFTYTGDATNLKAQIQPAPIPINSTVVRPHLPGDVTILRTYHVPIVPNAAIPGDDAIVTETQKEVPALSNMFMRLNFEETPQLGEHKTFIKTLDIEFTPRVNSTDFGLVVSVIDGPPGVAPLPAEELRPIYVDVRWVGNFPGTESPAVQTYYQNPPTFTFTVNDQWVQEQEANRDSNGVPILKLWLLNEGTNEWEQITAITRPVAGVGGTYTFVATLPHFSDYAITATKAPRAPGTGGNPQPPSPPVPSVVPPVALAVNLLESIALGDQQQSVPIEVIEEFGERKLSVRIADAIAILSKPVSYKTFQVGDVNVRITVQGVKQESVIPPKATATFLVELENLGDKEEEFTLNFWYYDQSGKKPYKSSQVATIGPYESKQLLVDVPFTEPGVFEVTAEARSIPGDDLVNTVQLTVTIPWLAINLYVLVVVAVAILGASGGVMAVLLRGGLAGAGAGTVLFFLAKKRKPTIRVTDRLAAIEDEYDVVVEVRQKEAQGAQAVFDLEIVNRSKRTQEFVLKYWAADLSGIKMSEHVERVRIKGQTTEVKAVQVVLPPGQNVFVAEAGPVSEKQARWSHAGVRVRAG